MGLSITWRVFGRRAMALSAMQCFFVQRGSFFRTSLPGLFAGMPGNRLSAGRKFLSGGV